MESFHETGRLVRIDAALLPTCQSLRAIHAGSHTTYSFVTHQTRIEGSPATKLRRTYLLCGYEASSLTQGLLERAMGFLFGQTSSPLSPNVICPVSWLIRNLADASSSELTRKRGLHFWSPLVAS